jgi:long-chain fatty acid transport protein
MMRLPGWDNKKWTIIITLGLLVLFPQIAVAGAPVHGAKAAGMGTAFVAIADDPSAILHNAAGLTQLKSTNVYGGITAVIPSTKYESPSGESEETKFQVFFPPHLYFSSDLNTEKLAVGLGIFSPFGIGGRDWSNNGPTRYISTESTIATITVNPTAAWQITPWLSTGFGGFYLYSVNTADRMVDQSMFGAGDGKSKLDADGDGWGYNFGILVWPLKELSLGFAYRSKVNVKQRGKAKFNNIAPPLQPLFGGSNFETTVHTEVDFPEIVSFGIAYRPTQVLTIELEAEWARWSRFNEQHLDFEDEVPGAGFTDVTVELDWHDAWALKAGVEYKPKNWLALRGGYAFVETPVPESTLSPANPDADRHHFSIGFGYLIGKWTVDGFYSIDIVEDRKVNNDILSGEYENLVHYIGLSVGHRF